MLQILGSTDSLGGRLYGDAPKQARRKIQGLLRGPHTDLCDLTLVQSGNRGRSRAAFLDVPRSFNTAVSAAEQMLVRTNGVRKLSEGDRFAMFWSSRNLAVFVEFSTGESLEEDDLLWLCLKGAKSIHVHNGFCVAFEELAVALKRALVHVNECEHGRHRAGNCGDAA